jgi:pentachlorophenol monooxygenase/3-(3-hydroxy-phenyl)propionate hydroxylase
VTAVADIDPDNSVREVLGTRPGEAWVIRPDGHIAAVGSTPAQAAGAVRRLLALV